MDEPRPLNYESADHPDPDQCPPIALLSRVVSIVGPVLATATLLASRELRQHDLVWLGLGIAVLGLIATVGAAAYSRSIRDGLIVVAVRIAVHAGCLFVLVGYAVTHR